MSIVILIYFKLFVSSLNKKFIYSMFVEDKPPVSNELNTRHTYITLTTKRTI